MILSMVFIRKKIASGRILVSGFTPHHDGAGFTPRHDHSAGFTLIELVITIGVFSIGVLAAFSLAIGNSNDNRANKDRIIAANLAREALELTRNIRDSDWLCTDSNDCYFGDSILVSNNFILVDYDVNSNGVATVGNYADLEQCMNDCKNANPDDCRMYIDGDGFYSHDSVNGSATNFSRVVGLQRICLDPAIPLEYIAAVGANCRSGETQIGVEATVSVAWDRAGKANRLELSDRFYNWR